MPFVETEASVRYEIIDGKRVPVITPKSEVTLTNTVTGKEYMSDAEAMQDVQNPNSSTQSEHIRRDVKVTVESLPIGTASNISDWRGLKKQVKCKILHISSVAALHFTTLIRDTLWDYLKKYSDQFVK